MVIQHIAAKHCAKIHLCPSVQRGILLISNTAFINTVLYIMENGCKWRTLPERFRNWHSVYVRFRRTGPHAVGGCQ